MPDPEREPRDRTGAWATTALLAALLCCTGPVLLAALGVSLSGLTASAILRSPWLAVTDGMLLAVVIAGLGWSRRRQ